MKYDLKKIAVSVVSTLIPFMGYSEMYNNTENETQDLSSKTSQDLFVDSRLCRDKNFCSYFQMDVGYRQDSISNTSEIQSMLYDISGSRSQKVHLSQLNLKAGMRFVKYLFVKGDVGFGFLAKDTDVESSYLNGTNYLVNSYKKQFYRGSAFDVVAGGGLHLPIRKSFSLDPEIGYMIKKITVEDSLKIKISGGYAGAAIYYSPGYHLGLSVFGHYLFAPGMNETGYLYFVKSNSFLKFPDIRDHNMTVYKVGASASYLFAKNLSVSFNWERFSASSSVNKGSLVTGMDFYQKLDYWHSNKYQIGFRYSF